MKKMFIGFGLLFLCAAIFTGASAHRHRAHTQHSFYNPYSYNYSSYDHQITSCGFRNVAVSYCSDHLTPNGDVEPGRISRSGCYCISGKATCPKYSTQNGDGKTCSATTRIQWYERTYLYPKHSWWNQ